MYVCGGVEGLQFPDVEGEVLGGEVAEVDGAGAVVGELVGGGAADAEGGVGAGDDDYFVFYSSAPPPTVFCISVLIVFQVFHPCGREEGTYGPAESPAIRRILGIPSKVPGSAGLTTSCSLRARRRDLETDVMLGFLRALRSCWSSSDGIFKVWGEDYF